MSDFLRLVRKETRELLRPRYLLPILLMPVIFIALGQGFGGIEDDLGEPAEIGIVNDDDGEYGQMLVETMQNMPDQADVVYNGSGSDPDTALEEVEDAGGSTVIVIPSNFTERIENGSQGKLHRYTSVESVGIASIGSSGKVSGILEVASQRLTIELTGATPTQLDPLTEDYTTYVKGIELQAAPGVIAGAFSTQFIFVPIVLMLVILVSGQMVMNSMGIEKENKTLETLLTMPVKRRTIVAAKLVGSASIGLAAAGIYTVALWYYQQSFALDNGGFPLSLGGMDYALIGVSLALTLVGTLALALCLGIFAGDRQGAQMLLFPLSVLAIVPMFFTMFMDLDSLSLPVKALLLAIPFTHPIIAPKRLLFGDTTLVLGGIVYVAVFAVGMIWLAIYLFNSDRLITGSAGRLSKYLSLLQR